jgi:predicted RNA-binding Zn ribbon-like protein
MEFQSKTLEPMIGDGAGAATAPVVEAKASVEAATAVRAAIRSLRVIICSLLRIESVWDGAGLSTEPA